MTTPQQGTPIGGSGSGSGAPVATAPAPPAPAVRGELTCPVCATMFAPKASNGRCPVCNEQVVPAELVRREIRGLSPALRWFRAGGWRLVVLVLFILYQAALLIYLWRTFADQHVL
ncbi:MAG TPA: hypothetical protein VKQ30_14110 [Ktedonobacterales bacterium]|nr:hypothetical protein [Ktedonobacterales bacterium]